jgi:hypothetical protein
LLKTVVSPNCFSTSSVASRTVHPVSDTGSLS